MPFIKENYCTASILVFALSCTTLSPIEFNTNIIPHAKNTAKLLIEKDEQRVCSLFINCTVLGKRYSCFLDSGAAISILNQQPPFDALVVTGHAQQKGAHGDLKKIEIVKLSDFSIANRMFNHFLAGRTSLFKEAKSVLVGSQVFSRSAVSFSFSEHKLTFLENITQHNLQPLQLANGVLPIIPLTINGKQYWALWDTGAQASLINTSLIKSLPAGVARSLKLNASVMSITQETRNLQIYELDHLDFTSVKVKRTKILATDFQPINRSIDRAIDLVLGLDIITQFDWQFDFSQLKWTVKRAKKPFTDCQIASEN